MYVPTISWPRIREMRARLAKKHAISELHAMELIMAAQETASKESADKEDFKVLFSLELNWQFDGLTM